MSTLSKLNIYLFVPGFVFHNVSTSTLGWSTMGGIVGMTLLQVITLGLLVWGIGKTLRVQHKTLAAIALAVMFYNSGNYGLPLADLAFHSRGAAVQAFVMMTQNILTFTIGLGIAAWAGAGGFASGIATLFRLPILPTLAAALLGKWWIHRGGGFHPLPPAIAQTAQYVSNGMVPLALATVGAQLAGNPRWPRWRPVSMVLVLRLLLGPIQMAALLWLLHELATWFPGSQTLVAMDLWPWPAQLLILTASVPTAVNTLLLTMELDGDADLAADCVFWTTIASCITIPIWLVVGHKTFG